MYVQRAYRDIHHRRLMKDESNDRPTFRADPGRMDATAQPNLQPHELIARGSDLHQRRLLPPVANSNCALPVLSAKEVGLKIADWESYPTHCAVSRDMFLF
jgi:hypothetical protein